MFCAYMTVYQNFAKIVLMVSVVCAVKASWVGLFFARYSALAFAAISATRGLFQYLT